MGELIAITGASGTVGGLVAAALSARIEALHQAGRDAPSLRLIGRDPARLPALPHAQSTLAPGYSDGPAMTQALTGAASMLLVSGRESRNRVDEHCRAIDAAATAGVQYIVYTSFYGAAPDCTFTFGRDHWHTEQYIRSTGLGFTFLRDNFYLGMLPALVGPDGVIRGPAGSGRVAAVAQTDVAAVAARALSRDTYDGWGSATLDLTGPQSLSLDEVAAILSRVSGRTVRYEEETVEQAYASRAHYGAPAFEVDGWVSTYVAIARGEVDGLTDAVQGSIGREPQSFEQFLADNPDRYSHLRG